MPLQSTRKLHQKLRDADRHFTLYSPNPRMLPREHNPRRLDVAVQHITPEKVRRQPRHLLCCAWCLWRSFGYRTGNLYGMAR